MVVVIVAILAMVFVVEVVQVSPHSFWEPFVQKMYCPLNLVYCSSPLGKGSFCCTNTCGAACLVCMLPTGCRLEAETGANWGVCAEPLLCG